MAANAVRLTTEGVSVEDRRVPVETLCLHGDNQGALEFALKVRQALAAHGVKVLAMGEFLL